jgi:hypothetical protein
MRRISSSLTWWLKNGFPAIWFGFLGLVTLASIRSVILREIPGPALLIPLAYVAHQVVNK